MSTVRYITRVPTRVRGIPCLVGVVRFDADEVDYDVLDRNGRYAAWLERKVDVLAHDAICADVRNEMGAWA